jgi:hypothetical protein
VAVAIRCKRLLRVVNPSAVQNFKKNRTKNQKQNKKTQKSENKRFGIASFEKGASRVTKGQKNQPTPKWKVTMAKSRNS